MKAHHNIFLLSTNLIRSQCVSISGSPYMNRKPESELVPLDTELERTLRNLKKGRSAESAAMVEQQETNQNIPSLEIERPQR